MPFAALICAVVAHRRGFSVWRFALIGSAYSALLFVPWIYLMRQLISNRFASGLVSLNYEWVYTFWLGWILTYTICVSGFVYILSGFQGSPTHLTDQLYTWFSLYHFGAIGASVLAWVLSRRSFFSRICDSRDLYQISADNLHLIRYIMPFVYIFAGTITFSSIVVYLFLDNYSPS